MSHEIANVNGQWSFESIRKSESGHTVEIRRLTLTEFAVLIDGEQVFSGRNKRAEVVAQWWLDGCQS